jgi:hypothetical protein
LGASEEVGMKVNTEKKLCFDISSPEYKHKRRDMDNKSLENVAEMKYTEMSVRNFLSH